jgi:4-hydroxybenzoate polyprenyltransferase
MKIELQAITFFISAMMSLAGLFSYMAGHIFPLLWITAFICLLATVGIDLIDRMEVERRVKDMLDDEKLPWMCRRECD